MKKVAALLAVVMCFCACFITATAQSNIPVSAVISETDNGDIYVVLYSKNPEKLVSFFTVIEYDTTLYSFKDAKASTTESSDGTLSENFTGAWAFGKLADGTGCAGAFVSYSGVTRKGDIPACEFIIHPETSRKDVNDIKIFVKEYITDDGDEENDIRKKTPVNFKETDVDISEIFDYSGGETVTITSIKTDDKMVFIPENIEGLTVRSINTDKPLSNTFAVFGRNVLHIGENVFCSENTAVAPENSAPVAAVKIAGGSFFSYRENVVADLNEPVFYTHQYLVNQGETLFETNAGYEVLPSHKTGGFWGTGTVITLKSSDSSADFELCVKGDINGDSVCDVLDVMLCERYVNSLDELTYISRKSAEFTGENVVDVNDYAQLVNQSLDGGYTVFDGVRGDLNGDYAIDILDIAVLNKMIKSELTQSQKIRADLDNDGKITSSDINLLELLIESFA